MRGDNCKEVGGSSLVVFGKISYEPPDEITVFVHIYDIRYYSMQICMLAWMTTY